MKFILEFIFTFIGILFIALLSTFAVALVFGFPLMFLWNNILVGLLKVPIITYWESVGLYLLSSILVKSFNMTSDNNQN